MNLQDLKREGRLDDLPMAGPNEYALLWISDYWDAPLSGMISYQGGEYWFEMFSENDAGKWFRRYAIVILTAEQLEKEHNVHRDFQRYVGTHWDVPPGSLHPEGQSHLFYDEHLEYCRTRHFNLNEVVAWFER